MSEGLTMDLDIQKPSPREPHADLGVLQVTTKSLHHWQKQGLNKHLICWIGHLNDDESETNGINCLLEDAEFALENQYSSPFENSNPEGKLPNLMGMIQSGMITPTISTLVGAVDGVSDGITGAIVDGAEKAGNAVNEMIDSTTGVNLKQVATDKLTEWGGRIDSLKGRTSFTKINSQQIYTSSNAVRISGTLVLVAWANAKAEVENKLSYLQRLATPIQLSNQSLLQNVATADDKLLALFPSIVPPAVYLKYGGKTYKPLFVESLSAPITAPMTADGSRIAVKVQISLVSKMAWDNSDIVKLYESV